TAAPRSMNCMPRPSSLADRAKDRRAFAVKKGRTLFTAPISVTSTVTSLRRSGSGRPTRNQSRSFDGLAAVTDTAVLINRHGGAASRDPEIGAKVSAALKAAGVRAKVELIDGGQCE